MRKQTKLVAVLSAAALLAIGASMTSFAATGWQKEDDTWYYYEKDGGKAYDKWQKSGDYWFYLGSDGAMVTSTLLEDGNYYYFLNEDGAMVTNTWVQITDEDYDETSDDTYWYYFQNSGRAYQASTDNKTSFKTINGKKYAFADDGKMLYGWVNDDSTMVDADDEDGWQEALYYCGNADDGSMKTGWCLIDVIDNDATTDETDKSYWFWFQASGKKFLADNGEALEEKSINGQKYGFDERGVMVSEWNEFGTKANASTNNATNNNAKYFSVAEDGHLRRNTWFKAIPTEEMDADAYNNEEEKWFYADSKGYVVRNQIKTINGKKYLFNNEGIMQSGLKGVEVDEGGDLVIGADGIKIKSFDYIDQVIELTDYDVYCFGDDGAMKTGTQTIEIDGEKYLFGFAKTGANKGKGYGFDGVPTIVDNKIYVNGSVQVADSDMRYEVKLANAPVYKEDGSLEKDADGNVVYDVQKFVVNTAGTIMKNKKNLKDADEYYYCTDKQGHFVAYEAEKCGSDDRGECTYHAN